jgi:uncharacterized protein YkwD
MKTRKSITYLFRGLVLGALMIAAAGIYFGATSSGAGDDPSSRGNQLSIAAPSSQTQSSFRIMEEQRAADRQEDLKDMIRYWNQLKNKEVEDEMD